MSPCPYIKFISVIINGNGFSDTLRKDGYRIRNKWFALGGVFYLCHFQEMLEALKALSVFFTENSLRTRRNLRGDIERRSLAINEEFAQIFKEVKEVTESFPRKSVIN